MNFSFSIFLIPPDFYSFSVKLNTWIISLNDLVHGILRLSRKLGKVQNVDFRGTGTNILWRGYEERREDLPASCPEFRVDKDQHLVPEETMPDWLTIYTREKYSNGRGSCNRMLVAMDVVRLLVSWPFLMC